MSQKKRQKQKGEDQLARVVLNPSDNGDLFPNDWLEVVAIVVAMIGISGGLVALWHLASGV